jgi:hypothetical protein
MLPHRTLARSKFPRRSGLTASPRACPEISSPQFHRMIFTPQGRNGYCYLSCFQVCCGRDR